MLPLLKIPDEECNWIENNFENLNKPFPYTSKMEIEELIVAIKIF